VAITALLFPIVLISQLAAGSLTEYYLSDFDLKSPGPLVKVVTLVILFASGIWGACLTFGDTQYLPLETIINGTRSDADCHSGLFISSFIYANVYLGMTLILSVLFAYMYYGSRPVSTIGEKTPLNP
jgi:hypothetical protein